MSFFTDNYLSYAPVLDKKRAAIATRLSILNLSGKAPSASEAYQQLASVWPDSAGVLLIDLNDQPPNAAIGSLTPRKDLWMEVPADFAAEPDNRDVLTDLAKKGLPMVLCGHSSTAVPAELLKSFRLHLCKDTDDAFSGASKSAPGKVVPLALTGVFSIAQMEKGFKQGAVAVQGWPVSDCADYCESATVNPGFATVTKLIQMVAADADPAEMEKEISRDPALAYRLLRFLNSPAFGLSVEVQSFQHALMMLGFTRLKKWLALLIATAASNINLQPLMYASLRRGFILEKLVKDDPNPQAADEAFILGVFSLLDQLFGEPFESLFERLPIPASVQEALVGNTGPLAAYLNIVKALEHPVSKTIDDTLTSAFISPKDCNDSLLGALAEANSTTAS